MNSDARNWCSHQLGFPIRKSPDHNLLAASRSLSQLTTSFIAYLRQGIHTHALSSLTIKSTSHTTGIRPHPVPHYRWDKPDQHAANPYIPVKPHWLFGFVNATFSRFCDTGDQLPAPQKITCVFVCPSIFSCQRSRLPQQSVERPSSTNC